MKWLSIIFKVFNTVKPWIQDYVLPAVRIIKAVKIIVKEENRDIRALLYRIFKDDAKVDKALQALAIAIKVLDDGSDCFNKPTPIEVIQCFVQKARLKDKKQQRHIWRTLAKSLIRQSTSGKHWEESDLNLAVEIAVAAEKSRKS